ncbi:MAG: hypothetical protein LBP87_00285 [Planctomycetaceae bacterium]|nr:hypothetical protein [Planctomycetaceae bacterium]
MSWQYLFLSMAQTMRCPRICDAIIPPPMPEKQSSVRINVLIIMLLKISTS